MKLIIAKDGSNRGALLMVLASIVLINYLPLIIGRLVDGHTVYNRVPELSMLILGYLVLLASFFILFGYLFALLCKFSLVVRLSFKKELKIISVVYIPSVIYLLMNFDKSTRYTSGGYTPVLLLAYTLVSALNLYIIFRLFKQRSIAATIPMPLKLLLVAGQFILVDGIGPALMLLFLIMLLFKFIMKNYFYLIVLNITFVMWSFYFKYQNVFSFDLVKDVIWRLAIRMESFVNHLNGESTINSFSNYFSYYLGWLNERLGFLFAAEMKTGSAYKSLSESIFQDLYRGVADLGFVGGSSPGIFYWVDLTYGGLFFGIFIFYFLLKNFVALSARRDVFFVVGTAYFVNEVISDMSEVVLILSPAFIYFIFFVVASFVVAKEGDYGG